MSEINKDTVFYLAKLCALRIDDDLAEKYCKQLNELLIYSQKLNELNTDGIDPSFHTVNVQTLLREDEPIQAENSNILKNSPEKEGTSYLVPRILD